LLFNMIVVSLESLQQIPKWISLRPALACWFCMCCCGQSSCHCGKSLFHRIADQLSLCRSALWHCCCCVWTCDIVFSSCSNDKHITWQVISTWLLVQEKKQSISVCSQCRAYLFVKNDTGEEQFEKIWSPKWVTNNSHWGSLACKSVIDDLL